MLWIFNSNRPYWTMQEFCNNSHIQQMCHTGSDHVQNVSLTLLKPEEEKESSNGKFCHKVYFNFTAQNLFENRNDTETLTFTIFIWQSISTKYFEGRKGMTTPFSEEPFAPPNRIFISAKTLYFEELRVLKIRLHNPILPVI